MTGSTAPFIPSAWGESGCMPVVLGGRVRGMDAETEGVRTADGTGAATSRRG